MSAYLPSCFRKYDLHDECQQCDLANLCFDTKHKIRRAKYRNVRGEYNWASENELIKEGLVSQDMTPELVSIYAESSVKGHMIMNRRRR